MFHDAGTLNLHVFVDEVNAYTSDLVSLSPFAGKGLRFLQDGVVIAEYIGSNMVHAQSGGASYLAFSNYSVDDWTFYGEESYTSHLEVFNAFSVIASTISVGIYTIGAYTPPPSGVLDVTRGKLCIPQQTINNSSDAGTSGEMCYDSTYLYVYVGSEWKRVNLSAW